MRPKSSQCTLTELNFEMDVPQARTVDSNFGRSDLKPQMARLPTPLVSDSLWRLVESTVPTSCPRPQGGGRRRVDDRAVFTAIAYVLLAGCTWNQLPSEFGVTVPTAHRRFTEWTRADLWSRLHDRALDDPEARSLIHWTQLLLSATMQRTGTGCREHRHHSQSGVL